MSTAAADFFHLLDLATNDTTMRVQKGLPRTILPAPSMSPRALPRTFPPSEALKKPKYNEPELAVETYSQLQPPDASALVAFAHRIGIASIFSAEDDMPSLVRQTLTHSSFAPFHQSHYPDEAPPPTNASLAAMGNSLLGLFATEHIHASYPHLPVRVLKATVSAYVGPRTCQAIAKEIGVAPLLRWARTVRVYSIFCTHSNAHDFLLCNFFSVQHQLNPPCYIQMQWNRFLVR